MKRALASKKPIKMWIDGKCFEVRRFQKHGKKTMEEGEYPKSQINYEITKNEQGKLFTSFNLPQFYYSKLTKFPDLNLKTLETNTNTVIAIPRNGPLLITGEAEEKIAEARDTIHSVLSAIRDSTKALQFISIPIRSTDVAAKFTQFRDEILGEKIEGMDKSIFISPQKLHLTVVVFALLDDNEKSEAIQALQDYKKMILDPFIEKTGPVKIRVSGIDCMNNNYKKVNVLYANAKFVEENEEQSLQKFVNDLSDHFYDRGLVRTYQENVKLHMTLINTKYRKVSNSPKKTRWGKSQSFDATTIMEKYKDITFGDYNVDTIELSLMGSVGDDGYYKPISLITVT